MDPLAPRALAFRLPETERPSHGQGPSGGMLRICLLSYRSHPQSGGQGVYLRYISQALVAAGHSVDVISGPPYPELDPRVRLIPLPGLDLYATGNPLRALGRRELWNRTNLAEWASFVTGGFPEPRAFGERVRAYLRAHRGSYDVVHDNQSLAPALLALKRDRMPVVATIHHPITVDRAIALANAPDRLSRLFIRRWYRFTRMQARVARRLGHIAVVSERTKLDTARDFGVPPEAMRVIHNGIDTALFRPLPEVPRRSDLLVATASADVPLKGLHHLLHAYVALLRERPTLDLAVVGPIQPGGATDRLLGRLGLRARVRFTGRLSAEEIVRLYAEATLAVVPSLYEGFGLPAGEAMACGVPLVSTSGGALPEVVGDAGLLVPPGDPEALAAAIAALLDDPERRIDLALRGRARICAHFRWPAAAEALTDLYRTAIADAHH